MGLVEMVFYCASKLVSGFNLILSFVASFGIAALLPMSSRRCLCVAVLQDLNCLLAACPFSCFPAFHLVTHSGMEPVVFKDALTLSKGT